MSRNEKRPEENITRESGRRSPLAGYLYVGLAWGFVACIVIQTFLAGLAVFTDASHWNNHKVFVHIFEFIPIVMLITAFIGKLPKVLRWQSLALFLLTYSQYFTANLPQAGALHPVIALVLFWLSVKVAKQAGRWCSLLEAGQRVK